MIDATTPDLQLDDINAWVDERRDALLARLFRYLSQPSISAYGEGIAEAAELIAGELEGIGLAPRIMPTAGWPMVFAERHVDDALPTILLYGHYDVQPPDPLEEWHSEPFVPIIRDGRIWARGVGDNKGQHFANILGIEAILACRGSLPCNVKVLLEGEEEIGSPQMPVFARAQRDLLAADVVITSDGPVHENGRSTINFGVRGVLSFDLKARGANRDLHSGNWGGVAPNPIWTLVQLLATMKDADGRVLVKGFYDAVEPQSAAEQAAIAALPLDLEQVMHDLDLEALDAPRERGFYERLSAWPTFTINGFHGGYGGPGSKTVLPHEAIAKCDVRLVEAQTAGDVFALLEAHVREHAPTVEIVRHGSMDPSKTAIDHPFAAPIEAAITQAQGTPPLLVPALGGSLPDYVFTKVLQMPAFLVPYANIDERNHAPNENLELERFFMGIRTGAAMVLALAAHGRVE